MHEACGTNRVLPGLPGGQQRAGATLNRDHPQRLLEAHFVPVRQRLQSLCMSRLWLAGGLVGGLRVREEGVLRVRSGV